MAVRILILSDGRPGHFNLSEGIAAAIGRRVPSQIARLTVRRRWAGLAAAMAVNAGLSPERLLRLLYGLDARAVPPADIVVSAGAETLAASVALARFQGIPNVFYGSLRRFRPEDFALVLTSYARNADRPNHAMALKPAHFDPDAMPPRVPGPPSVVGVLIGGDTPGIRYTHQDWTDLAALFEDIHVRAGAQLLVSNSRRTPEAVSERLAVLAAGSNAPIRRFVDVRTPGAPRLTALFAEAHALIVTADSSSMLSEACWARRPVIALAPAATSLNDDEASYRDWLESQGWCRRRMIASATAESLMHDWAALTPMRENPLDALADLMTARLPRIFQR